MLLIAAVFDLISLIPIVNMISSIIAWLIFSTWFYFLGAGLLNPKKFATVSVSFLAELIPFISMLPLTTLGVGVLIFLQNHPVLGKLAHKGLNTKKQALNKKIQGFESTKNQSPLPGTKKQEGDKESTNPNRQNLEIKPEITPPLSAARGKGSENQPKKEAQLRSREEEPRAPSTPDKKESDSKENNSEDQRVDYEKNKQDIKNIEYLQGKIPQRRLIKDIDLPAPYGENDQDELNMTA